MAAHTQCIVSVDGSKFLSNTTSHEGGAIMASVESDMIILNSEFANSKAGFGGAVFITQSAKITISMSLLHHNAAVSIHNNKGTGGVLVAAQQCTVILDNCEVWNNTAIYGAV